MPASTDSLKAAATYRTAQLTYRTQFLRDFATLWPVLDKANISKTSPDWLRLVIGLIAQWRKASAVSAASYYEQAHALDVGKRPPLVHLPPPLPDEQVIRSLLYTGPGQIKRSLDLGLSPEAAHAEALVTSGQSGARLVLSGGRDLVNGQVREDKTALGWMRVTDDDPCGFCAMLASRGPVFKSAKTAGRVDARDVYGEDAKGFANRYHDKCACTVVPVFTQDSLLPDSTQHYADLWESTTKGLSGKAARNAFRRAVENP